MDGVVIVGRSDSVGQDDVTGLTLTGHLSDRYRLPVIHILIHGLHAPGHVLVVAIDPNKLVFVQVTDIQYVYQSIGHVLLLLLLLMMMIIMIHLAVQIEATHTHNGDQQCKYVL